MYVVVQLHVISLVQLLIYVRLFLANWIYHNDFVKKGKLSNLGQKWTATYVHVSFLFSGLWGIYPGADGYAGG